MRRRVAALAENRPGVYRMRDAAGHVLYVGKAKCLRRRLLSYFRPADIETKAGRIIRAAADLEWEYQPSEFAACLAELRQIRRFRPVFNVQLNRSRRLVFIKVSSGPAPKVFVAPPVPSAGMAHYGPFPSPARTAEAVRVLNDLLGLRDCALELPMHYAEQGDLFGAAPRAGCLRYDFGTCSGPCAGLVAEADYRARVAAAVAFLEGRALAPLDRVIAELSHAIETQQFERAARARERFEALEWLLAASVRARAAIEALTFVYTDPGVKGDARAYVIRRATVRASAPAPLSPIEREAFRALVAAHAGPEPEPGALAPDTVEEKLLILSWFRRHPSALRRTEPLTAWLDQA
jgi:excinuclease ABC subunit C